LNKDQFPRRKNNIFTILTVFAVGFISVNSANYIFRRIFNTKKVNIERNLSLLLDKEVLLGEYSGLRFLGINLKAPKISDKNNYESRIESKYIYLKILPLKSILNKKIVLQISPRKLKIDINKNFFQRDSISKKNRISSRKYNYDIYFDLKNKSNLKIRDIGINAKVEGKFLYRSKEKQLIGNLDSNLKRKGNLKLKINKKFNNNFFSLNIKSRGLNLDDFKYNKLFKENISLQKGTLKSNFNLFRSDDKFYCGGKLFLYSLNFKTSSLSENINADSFKFICSNNVLSASGSGINYGTIISSLKFDVPFKNKINNIKINGELGYINSIQPEINLSGEIPFWINKKGFNFGSLDSRFNLYRTQLSNLNFFRKNGIRGYITASGKLTGELNNLNSLINFNIEYPHFKGIRIREIWDGKIINKNDGYLLKMNNRYSPIPSFLSIKVNSKLKLDNVEFSRIFDSNKGSLNIVRKENYYEWQAKNFPLNELELSIEDNKFDRVDGTINGSGLISPDQSYLDGVFSLSLGKYRNIKLSNSLFDIIQKDKTLNINSSLYPIDGGMIDIVYKSNSDELIKVDLKNISANWTAYTIFDVLNFNKKRIVPRGTLKDLKNVQIFNDQKTLDEQFDFLNSFIEKEDISINQKRLINFLNKFEGRYGGKLNIAGSSKSNYQIKSKLSGYLNEKNNLKNIKNNNFSLSLEGGLFNNKGSLIVNQFPLNVANLFFDKSKDLKGSLDLNLDYDFNEKSFISNLSSNQTSLNNYEIRFQNGDIGFNNSIFDINLSFLLGDSGDPITLIGSVPIFKNQELDLRLKGDERFLDLIDSLFNKNFIFKKGEANLRMLIKGFINKPIANGFLYVREAEIELFQNDFKNLEGTFIFDFDQLEIKDLRASGSKFGNIFLKGSLPFYEELKEKDTSLNFSSVNYNFTGNNIDFIFNSNISITGSFATPYISGNIGLKDGFINFKGNNRNDKKTVKIKNDSELWPELFWRKDKEIEIISNESILNKNLFNENLPDFLAKVNFNDLNVKLGPDFRLEYGNILSAYLDTRIDLKINGNFKEDLNARGLVDIKKGRANLYTTPFKLDKNKDNYILFASRNGITPYLDFSLTSKVPDTIIPITENNKDTNLSDDLSGSDNASNFGTFGIGNTRLIKIEASYQGFLDQLSFEDENKKIKLRSTPTYSRSQIIGLIGGNSANLINRAFISQLNGANGFSERFQLSIYPALIENNEPLKNIFSSEKLDLEESQENSSNDGLSSQAWVAEIGLDITDNLNFAMQTTPDRDDIPPLWILTLQANQYLEILGSFDSNGDWKSQLQLFFRY
tara:strand:- start:858 stop:4799 length:3942 start_codon:yes stop_codon:yes gene_type:complete